jgi:hypothetical protein
MGEIGILNVGAGDTKLTFDKDNLAECIRAARIVADMLRRGYALLVEVETDGVKKYQRVIEFRPDRYEYVIADFDPMVAAAEDAKEKSNEEIEQAGASPAASEGAPGKPRRGRPKGTRIIAATGARGVAVPHMAGG